MTSSRRAFVALGTLATATLIIPGARAQTVGQTGARTLADTLAANPMFSQFLDLVTRAGAVEDLRQSDARTLFAPTNEGIATLAPTALASITGTTDSTAGGTARTQARPVILNHMVQGTPVAAQGGQGSVRMRTLNGTEIELVTEGSMMSLRNLAPNAPTFQSGSSPGGINVAATPIRIVGAPIAATNGVIYPINGVLMPT